MWLEFDLVLAITLAIEVGFVWFGWSAALTPFDVRSRSEIYGTCVALFGSLMGFAITAQALMLTLAHGQPVQPSLARLRASTQYPVLWAIFTQTIVGLAFATLASMVALLADRAELPIGALVISTLGTALFALVRLARLIWILAAVVALVTAGSDQERLPTPGGTPTR
jgi:hypothetical protein